MHAAVALDKSVVRWQSGLDIAAGEVNGTAEAGGRVAKRIESSDRDAEGVPRRTACRRRHGVESGSCRADADRGVAADQRRVGANR